MEKIVYSLDQERRDQFAAIYLLQHMVVNSLQFNILLSHSESFLEPLLVRLNAKGYLSIQNNCYQVTPSGEACVDDYLKRYAEYVQIFSIFCAVDLKAGKFAYASVDNDGYLTDCPILDIVDNEHWHSYLDDPRWEDLRVAVAQLKNMDPIEIIFMAFLYEGRFGMTADGWQFDLVLGAIWNEIVDIVNSNLQISDLGYEEVTGEAAIADIVAQGTHIAMQIIAEEARRNADKAAEDEHNRQLSYQNENSEDVLVEETEVVEVVEIVEYNDYDYYQPYWSDPYYVSPFWLLPVIVW